MKKELVCASSDECALPKGHNSSAPTLERKKHTLGFTSQRHHHRQSDTRSHIESAQLKLPELMRSTPPGRYRPPPPPLSPLSQQQGRRLTTTTTLAMLYLPSIINIRAAAAAARSSSLKALAHVVVVLLWHTRGQTRGQSVVTHTHTLPFAADARIEMKGTHESALKPDE